jgi:predicted RNA-binding Zn-ribbon protein involved in translation (DUF1610 family)
MITDLILYVPPPASLHSCSSFFPDRLDAREAIIESSIIKNVSTGQYVCKLCNFGATNRTHVFCHVESKHYQDATVQYACPYCQKVMYTRNARASHVSRYHKDERYRTTS